MALDPNAIEKKKLPPQLEPKTSAPPVNEFAQLPLTAFTEQDKVGEIRSVLRQLDVGMFNGPALLVDAMLRDDRVMGDLTTRINGLLSSPISHKAADDTPEAQAIADILGGDEYRAGRWEEMFPQHAVAAMLAWGDMLGVGVGELVWSEGEGPDKWKVRLKAWHPQFLYWRWDTRSFWLITDPSQYRVDWTQSPNEIGKQIERQAAIAGYGGKDAGYNYGPGLIELPNTDRNIHSNGKFVIYTPYGYEYGWRRALVRSIAQPYLIRQWTYRDWARSSETYGQGIRKAIVPSEADAKKKERYFRKVSNMNNETAVLVEQSADGKSKYDIELLEAKARTWEAFNLLIGRAEKSISIAILGQDSSDRAQGGSLAQFKGDIRDDLKRFDAKTMSETLVQQALYHWSNWNFGPGKTPKTTWEVSPPEDDVAEALALKNAADALTAFVGAGMPVDLRAYAEQYDIPLLDASPTPALSPAPVAPPTLPALPPAAPTSPPPTNGAAGAKLSETPHLFPQRAGKLVALGGSFEFPADHLPAMRVGPAGARCSSCDFLGGDGASCTNAGYIAWAGTDRLIDPITRDEVPAAEFCSDWFENEQAEFPPVRREEFQGIAVAIESPKGSVRQWVGEDGRIGMTSMLYDYGFIEGARGRDGDDLDCYVGPDAASPFVYIVHQHDPITDFYDEDKVMLGFATPNDAKEAFLMHRNDGDAAFGSMSVLPLDTFKTKLQLRKGGGKIRASALAVDESPVQTVIFEKAKFDEAAARNWLALNGYGSAIHVDEDRGSMRFRLSDATEFEKGSFKVNVAHEGVSTITGTRKALAAKKKRKPDYRDQLEQKAIAVAQHGIRADVQRVLAAVNAAKDPDDLRERLKKEFAEMDPTKLAKIVEKARIMANLAGRHVVIEAL